MTRQYRQKNNTPPAYRIAEPVDEDDIRALRALEAGTATEYQQRLALRLILVKLSGAYDQEFVIGQPDQTTFRSGRSFVGRKILHLLKTDITRLLGDEHAET